MPSDLENITPIYEELPGWESVVGARNWSDLPETAQAYIRYLEKLMGVKVGLISTSPDRNDTIIMGDEK